MDAFKRIIAGVLVLGFGTSADAQLSPQSLALLTVLDLIRIGGQVN
jgi:hypothetical protein